MTSKVNYGYFSGVVFGIAGNGSLVWLVRKNKPNHSIQNRTTQVQTEL